MLNSDGHVYPLLDSVRETEETKSILYLVDTAKITAEKYEKKNNKSYLNEVEAYFVMDHLKKLLGKVPDLSPQ